MRVTYMHGSKLCTDKDYFLLIVITQLL